ncbi:MULTISPECIES: molybdate ABC transporter substrate-binding protein [unclassified Pseudovibrio]|uniref:molybdate ABC transporter substrate-binding protein n=1 Tax=unclassified Pseudovibrio TaxID=2627060 RepID=UPI0007AE6464|nr:MULTISPECIES: molybdate ABC transporter substrate-binding protein [unclassified Pseudovibrio]KZK94399.1 Molybdate-binding periplasmic protein precursor [Pseudovibrio sp. W74]KZL04487.1 Molybdate-binding periplasmic protein precursor [Pseudovibrio sp. Ad14]
MTGFWRFLSAAVVSLALVVGGGAASFAQEPERILVFAASSLKDVLEDAGAQFDQTHNTKTEFSFGGSQTITRHVVAGAPADLLVTADDAWMAYAVKNGVLVEGSVVELASNGLVLVGSEAMGAEAVELKPQALQAALADGRLAMGEPETVPAGRYGKEALINLGLWESVAQRVAPMENVRIALAAAARGEVPLALVYSSDAKVEHGVRVLAEIPQDSHRAIVIPGALTLTHSKSSGEFMAFLKSAEGRKIFQAHGFKVSGD